MIRIVTDIIGILILILLVADIILTRRSVKLSKEIIELQRRDYLERERGIKELKESLIIKINS